MDIFLKTCQIPGVIWKSFTVGNVVRSTTSLLSGQGGIGRDGGGILETEEGEVTHNLDDR